MRQISPARAHSSDLKRAEPSEKWASQRQRRPYRATSNGTTKIRPRPVLGPGASAEELRERLVAQIAEIGSSDDAALWAYSNMRAKNGLSTADAHQVEEAFQGKLTMFWGARPKPFLRMAKMWPTPDADR